MFLLWEQLSHGGPDGLVRSLSWNTANEDQLPWEFSKGPVTIPFVQASGSQPRRHPTGVCEGPEAGAGRERGCWGPLGKGQRGQTRPGLCVGSTSPQPEQQSVESRCREELEISKRGGGLSIREKR